MYDCNCNNNIGAGNIISTDKDQYLRIEWCDNVTDVPTKSTFLDKIKNITDSESSLEAKIDSEIERAKTAEQNLNQGISCVKDALNNEILERRSDTDKLQEQINILAQGQQDKVITRTFTENTVTETFDQPNNEQILILQDENQTGSIKFDKSTEEVIISSKGKLKLENVATPIIDSDAANKKYVDDLHNNLRTSIDTLSNTVSEFDNRINESQTNANEAKINAKTALDTVIELKNTMVTEDQLSWSELTL